MKFSRSLLQSAYPRSNPLGDKAMLKSCDNGMAYFDVFGLRIAALFSKNQFTDHSSDLNDTVEDGLNYYVVFFDWYVITLSFNRSYPNCCLHFCQNG